MSKPQGKRSALLPILVAAAAILLGGWLVKSFILGGSQPVNILLMGLDEGKIRTDVVVVAHVDPKQKLISLLSLPRDTLVAIDCAGLDKACVSPDKLAHAHAYGDEKGPETTVRTVERLLNIKIDHYVRVDFDGFKQVVDRLGGVDLVIDQNMDYDDPYANPPLRIHFKASKEPQHLDGQKALNYVRFRSDGLGDIGRTERTKRFLTALAKKTLASDSITKLPSAISGILPYVKTDIDTSSAVSLARGAVGLNLDHIPMATLPGSDDQNHPRGWVWVPDKGKMAETVDQLIRNPKPSVPAQAPK